MSRFLTFVTIIIFYFNYLLALRFDQNTYINTKNITYDINKNTIELGKDSFVNINDINILTDKGLIDYNNNNFEIYGSFYLYHNENVLSGENLTGLIDLNQFTARNISYIYNNDLKIDSKNINRLDNKITFNDSFLTPCKIDGYFNCPTWSLKIPKTIYDINEDKFEHFDLFLQIADYKVFYTPYLSHYGNKAGRKNGFLYPVVDYDFKNHSTLFNTPYYIPFNQSYDMVIRPTFSIGPDLNFNSYKQYIEFNGKLTGGNIKIDLFNEFIEGTNEPFNTLKLNTSQILTKNAKVSLNIITTNNISKTRSKNETSLPFENIYFKLNNYNILKKNDLLLTKLSSVASYSDVNNSLIPVEMPSLTYISNINWNKNFTNFNKLKITHLDRNENNNSLPSDNYKISLNSNFHNNLIKNNFILNNKSEIYFNYNHVNFQTNSNLNYSKSNSYSYLSTELRGKINNHLNGRIKLVAFSDLIKDDLLVNENSNSYTFSYQNLFNEKRTFGSDLIDNSSRLVFGLENYFKNKDLKYNFNIGQSYDFKINSNYLNDINQYEELSDISLESKVQFNKFSLKFDSRNNNKTLSKKEINYSFSIDAPIILNLTYNETSKEAYRSLSEDSKSLKLNASKKINENLAMGFSSNLDLKENYDPYEQSIYFSFFDECSKFNISYTNTRFNDNFNTKPTETFRFEFHMDYLGFVGFEQSTNLIDNSTSENYFSSGIPN